MHDIIIKNGTIIDGSGRPMMRADLAIDEDKISFIGNLAKEDAHTVIDALGQYVCPGFIDCANRSDLYWQLFHAPQQKSLLYQGVTTIIGGGAGASLAPLSTHEDIAAVRKWTDLVGVQPDWQSVAQYLETIEQRVRPAINYGTLVGHQTLRRTYASSDTYVATEEECAMMQKSLARAMEEGALGLSSNARYLQELNEPETEGLLKIVKQYHGVYVAHLRDEADDLLRALDEALMRADTIGVDIHIAHLKASGKKNWPLMEQAIEMIEYARSQGVGVTFDVYPYTTTGSMARTFFPQWVQEGGRTMMLKRLTHKKTRERIIKELQESHWDFSRAAIAHSPMTKMLAQNDIGVISRKRGMSPEEIMVDVFAASEGHAMIMMQDVLHEHNVRRMIEHPFSMIASHAAGYNQEWSGNGMMVHPRSFGTFARTFDRYVKHKEVLSWEDAVRKMTAKVASRFGLVGKGTLSVGYDADVVVLDPTAVVDHATIDDPFAYASGVRHVIVGGNATLSDGVYTGARNGRVVRHSHV